MKEQLRALVSHRNPLRLGWHYARAWAAALLCGFPARSLTVIGITGTDGKTTTVSMVTHILLVAGKRVGSASTTFFQVGEKREENATHQTSMQPMVLQKFLRRLVHEKCEFAVIEMSSHGLVQGRVHHTFPSVSAITNTSREHLDYHGNMQQYRKDKGNIFRMLKGKGTKVLNASDESFALYKIIPSQRTITYGSPGTDMWLSDISLRETESSATLHTGKGGNVQLTLPVAGSFNLENALCAISCAQTVGIPLEMCVQALRSFRSPPGRLECIDEGQGFSVFVDFTVSPQAYAKILTTLQSLVKESGRVLVLCGSCGNRMKEKRPEVGRIVSEHADVVVVTEDETYGEDPHAILEEVWAGITQESCQAHKIFDRRKAIEWILREAKPGDAVALCGMGPYTSFTKLEGSIPWNEAKIARSVLRSLNHESEKILSDILQETLTIHHSE